MESAPPYEEKGPIPNASAPAYPPAGGGYPGYPPQAAQYPPAGQPVTQQPYPPAGQPGPPQYSTPPAGSAPYGQYAPGYSTQGGYVAQPTVQTVYMTGQPMENPPNDHMIMSVLSALFCCLCIGAFAVMKSNECQNAVRQGRREEAVRLSQEALRLSKITIGVGVGFSVCYVGFIILYCVLIVPNLYSGLSSNTYYG